MEKEDSIGNQSKEDLRQDRTCLPPHVQSYLYGSKFPMLTPAQLSKPVGFLSITQIQQDLGQTVRPFFDKKDKVEPCTSFRDEKDLRARGTTARSRPVTARQKMLQANQKITSAELEAKLMQEEEKLMQFENMVNQNVHKKIAFHPRTDEKMGIPPYVTARLEMVCQSARYELPVNRKCLEKMTPLEFLTTYTHLYRDLQKRYLKLFKTYKSRSSDFVEFSSLYPALNSMFGGFLSPENFEILTIALFLDETSTFDVNTFTAVCTYCDRLYWSSYLDGINTFSYWAPNRGALEVTDFNNLSWKLKGINLSKELRCLLFSLA